MSTSSSDVFESDGGAPLADRPAALRCDVHTHTHCDGRRPAVAQGDKLRCTTTDGDIFALFNATNAKLVVTGIVMLIVLYHCVLHLTSLRQDTCIGLLETGRYQGDHIWQPYGCMLHYYSQADSRLCIKKRRTAHGLSNWIVFVGDARTYQLFEKLVQQFAPETKFSDAKVAQGHGATDFYSRLDMRSHRFAENSIGLFIDYVEVLRGDDQLERLMNAFVAHRAVNGTPSLIVIGFALEFINETMLESAMQGGLETQLDYLGSNLTLAVEPMKQLRTNSTLVWMSQSGVDEQSMAAACNCTLYAGETNWAIARYNEATDAALGRTVRMWRSAALLANGYMRDSGDGGLSYGHVALDYHEQVLLNMHCNGRVHFADGTCCNAPEKLNVLQLAAFATYMLIIFAATLTWSTRASMGRCKPIATVADSRSEQRRTNSNAVQLLYTLARLSIIMVYFYTCDRADFFMKENKWFTYFNLFLPIAYLSVLGLFFMENTDNVQFLSHEQSDEWKGWMQLVMLSSQLTGAIEIQWVYMLNNAFISSYLFLLGYGHFMYFWNTADYGLVRLLRVLLRYNLLVALLCVSMNRPYQFYYFVPLVSFWFLVVYVTMACPPQVGSNSRNEGLSQFVMTMKLVILFSVISVLYLSQLFFERLTVAGPWRPLLTVSGVGGARAWWTKWWRYRYATPAGMVFAFAVSLLRHRRLLVDDRGGPLFASARLSYAATSLAAVGLLAYALLISQCPSRRDCDEQHAYVAFVPIVSYLVLRNAFGWVRCRASSLFAWFGTINLELMTAQHHVWMVADSAGVLVLLPRYPVLNVIVTSVVFVCVAHEIRACCKRLVPLVVPDRCDSRSALRNIFAALLAATVLCLCYAFYTQSAGDDDDAFA